MPRARVSVIRAAPRAPLCGAPSGAASAAPSTGDSGALWPPAPSGSIKVAARAPRSNVAREQRRQHPHRVIRTGRCCPDQSGLRRVRRYAVRRPVCALRPARTAWSGTRRRTQPAPPPPHGLRPARPPLHGMRRAAPRTHPGRAGGPQRGRQREWRPRPPAPALTRPRPRRERQGPHQGRGTRVPERARKGAGPGRCCRHPERRGRGARRPVRRRPTMNHCTSRLRARRLPVSRGVVEAHHIGLEAVMDAIDMKTLADGRDRHDRAPAAGALTRSGVIGVCLRVARQLPEHRQGCTAASGCADGRARSSR